MCTQEHGLAVERAHKRSRGSRPVQRDEPGCRASTSTAASSARARRPRCWRGWARRCPTPSAPESSNACRAITAPGGARLWDAQLPGGSNSAPGAEALRRGARSWGRGAVGRREAGDREAVRGKLPAMGIRTVMITGDNPVTARAIAATSDVNDILAEATPEDKLALIHHEQAGGRMVAMTGDGKHRRPRAGRRRRRHEHGARRPPRRPENMVDLDSDPTKLIGVVEVGEQMLITQRAGHVLARQRPSPSTSRSCRRCSSRFPQLGAQRHGARDPGAGDPLRGHLRRAGDRRRLVHSRCAARASARRRPTGCCGATCSSTGSAASSSRSWASLSSISFVRLVQSADRRHHPRPRGAGASSPSPRNSAAPPTRRNRMRAARADRAARR